MHIDAKADGEVDVALFLCLLPLKHVFLIDLGTYIFHLAKRGIFLLYICCV